jgi:DNA-binding transcriptional regulator YiaG
MNRSVTRVAQTVATSMSPTSRFALRQYSGKQTQLSVRSSTIVGERIVAFLREQHPVKTIESVSAETGVSQATIAKWFERASVPGGLAILMLAAAYGPEFLVAAYPKAPNWLRITHRAHRIDQLTKQQEALSKQLEELR